MVEGSNPSRGTKIADMRKLILIFAIQNKCLRKSSLDSSAVEHFLGKEEATGSSPVRGSKKIGRFLCRSKKISYLCREENDAPMAELVDAPS